VKVATGNVQVEGDSSAAKGGLYFMEKGPSSSKKKKKIALRGVISAIPSRQHVGGREAEVLSVI